MNSLYYQSLMYVLATAFICSLSQIGKADGLPQLGKACQGFNAPPGTAGTLFDGTCQTAYILPPSVGSIHFDSVAPSAAAGLCHAFQTVMDALDDQLSSAAAKIGQAGTHLREAEAKKCLKNAKAKLFLDEKIESARREVMALQEQLGSLDAKVDACTSAHGAGSSTCLPLKIQQMDLGARKGSLELDIASDEQFVGAIAAEMTPCGSFEKVFDAANLEAGSAQDRAKLDSLLDELFNLNKKYQNVEGSVATATILADHQALISQAQKSNAHFAVQGIPTQMALSISSLSNGNIELPAALRVDIPLLTLNDKSFGESSDAVKATIFGPSASGTVVLSLPATCAARGASSSGVPNIRPYLRVNATYKYPVQVGTKIIVTAKFDEIYKRIVENTTKGGLFRTSRSTSITDFTDTDEVISVKFDTTEDIPVAERSRIIAQIKSEVVGRALDLVAREYLPGIGPVTPGDPQKSGADKAAKALRENCASQWCQVGAVVLDVASSIFGGTSSIAAFVKEKHITETQEYNLNSLIYSYKTMGFE